MEETKVKPISEEKEKEQATTPTKTEQKETSTQNADSKNSNKTSESPKEETQEQKGEEKEKGKETEKDEDKNKDDSKDDSLKKKPKNWKKSRKKKSTKDDAYIGDIKNWPTLEEAAQPGQGGPGSPPTEGSTNAGQTSPQTQPQNQQSQGKSDEHKKAQKKKKGPNWVPFKDIIGAPPSRTTSSRGASGSGGGRRGKEGGRGGATTTTSDRPYRQSNYRQTNRGRGRGSYNNYMNYSRQDAYPNNQTSSRPYSYGKAPADPEALREAVIKQIEYYFSIENLCKDIWLRIQMDDQGWLPLSLITGFNRVKALTTDAKLITEYLKDSTLVEIQDGKIRKQKDWATWIFPPKTNAGDPTSPSTPSETPATTTTSTTTTSATTAATTTVTTTAAPATAATTPTTTSEVPSTATN